MDVPDLLVPVVDDPRRACLLCDFDGTISDIVEDPADARPLPGALDALAGLADRLGCVGVVSGRPVAWLAQQLSAIAAAPIELHGMYGMETWRDGEPISVGEAAPWRAVVERIAASAVVESPATVLVEPKGLSVGLHYRADPSDEAWVMGWAREQVEAHGVALLTGRMAVELRPPIDRDKGHAAAEILARHRPAAAAFFGDDTGDVPVALALRDYARVSGATAVVVCVDSEETPEQMRAVADLHVDGPRASVELLTALSAALGPPVRA